MLKDFVKRMMVKVDLVSSKIVFGYFTPRNDAQIRRKGWSLEVVKPVKKWNDPSWKKIGSELKFRQDIEGKC